MFEKINQRLNERINDNFLFQIGYTTGTWSIIFVSGYLQQASLINLNIVSFTVVLYLAKLF